jgi:hypothetical protein
MQVHELSALQTCIWVVSGQIVAELPVILTDFCGFFHSLYSQNPAQYFENRSQLPSSKSLATLHSW